jgi:hypothetical protein
LDQFCYLLPRELAHLACGNVDRGLARSTLAFLR